MPKLAAVPRAAHQDIEIDRETYFRTSGAVQGYRDYAEGRHTRVLTDQMKLMLENILDNLFCDNVCHQVIAEAADRVSLLRWDCDDDAVKEFLSDFYTRAHLDDMAGDTHYAALRDGNYALAVSWDNAAQRVTLQREPWWDGNTGVFIAYDTQGEPLYAVKEWDTLDGRRRLVWFEDRLERYIMQTGGGWEPHVLPGDDNQWPQWWTKQDGSPLHLPLIHFPNAGRGKNIYGTSELAGGVLGFQDQINDLQFDMTAAGRMTGFQMLFLSGVNLKGEDGKVIAPQVGPGQVFASLDPSGRGMVLPAGDISQLIRLYETKLRAVSRMTRTPLHLITGGDWPSGEALLRSEMPAVNKATRQIAKFSDCWASVAHRAVEVANAFGRAGLDEEPLVSAVFSPPERRDPLSKSAAIANISDKISIREALRIMGYSPEQAQAIYDEMLEEQDNMGGSLLSAFDKGKSGGGIAPPGDNAALQAQEKPQD